MSSILGSIDSKMRAEAVEHSANIAKVFKRKHNEKRDPLTIERDFYKGILGEIAFKNLLDARSVKYKYDKTIRSGSDNGDFEVYMRGEKKMLEVRTATGKHQTHLLFPEGKMHRDFSNGIEYYVSMLVLEGDGVYEVKGYMDTCIFKGTKPIVIINDKPMCGVLFTQLSGIDGLLSQLDKVYLSEPVL